MASQAVNAKSFANYIVSLCSYRNGSALSTANKTQLYNYLTEGFSNPQTLINIKTALAMLNRIVSLVSGTKATITTANTGASLSVNTAKALVDKVFNTSYRKNFITLTQLFPSRTITTDNTLQWSLYLPAATSFGSPTLKGTLYGGGGGASGAYAGDGDKNASYTITSGAGASGTASTITLNGSSKATANGGSGGAAVSVKVGGNPTAQSAGNAGSQGATTSVSFSVTRKVPLVITPGNGGGGGGGIGCSAGGTTGAVSLSANAGSGTTGGKGKGDVNEWSGEDHTFGGGGGGGGRSGSGGAYSYSGPWSGKVTVCQNGSSASNGVGGLGGSTNLGANNANQTLLGYPGNAAAVFFSTDEAAVANGGNGGNCGGFVVDSSCAAANALFVYRG